MRVEWLPEASRSLTEAVAWIAQHDSRAAIAVGDAVMAAVDRVGDFPHLARAGRVAGTRELPVTGTPYIVVYMIEPAAIVVLRILHGTQNWPPRR